MSDAVFVYGLLKPGFRLHHEVAGYVLRAEPATVRGRLYDVGVPAVRFDETGEVDGYVLHLDPSRTAEALNRLDAVEDEGKLYTRVLVGADTPGGRVVAWAYEYAGAARPHAFVGREWR